MACAAAEPFSTATCTTMYYKLRGRRQHCSPTILYTEKQKAEPEAMEGKKKQRVMASAVCVLVILLSAQRLPVGVADATSVFCHCYAACFSPGCSGEGWNFCHGYCCAVCHVHGDDDFDRVCMGGQRNWACGMEATGGDTATTDDGAANYWSRRHGKAKAKHG